MSGQDIAAIAAGLTKAQREAVLGRRDLSSGAGMWPLRNSLAEKGLVEGLASHWTPLGLAVRTHLTNGGQDG